jgi:hypothetical protein
MASKVEEVKIPEGIEGISLLADEFGIILEEHEGFFNLDEVKFLVYGESGSGKTVFSSTWPNTVFLDIDKGMSSVTRRVGRIPIHGTPQETAWDGLMRAIGFLETPDVHNFKTVVVDSLNEMQKIAMDHVITKFPQIRRPYDELASQSDYGKMLDDFDKAVRRLKALQMHVVLVCQVAPQQYETDIVQPQLVGKHTARNVARAMDVIGYLYKQEGGEGGGDKKERIMVFDAVNHVTKDRSDLLPLTVEDPTFSELYNYWQTQFEQEE